MNKSLAIVAVLAAFAGCNKQEQGSQTANPGAPNPAVPASPGMATTQPVNGSSPLPDMSVPSSQSTMDKMKSMGQSAADGMKQAGATLSDQAQTYLQQVSDYTQQKKYDLADATMAKLQALKDKLPADWQTKIDTAQETLNNAKKG